jgi:uncharacterized protein (TIGR02147 family)
MSSIFEYSDYRLFLKDYYKSQKARSASYSYAVLAKQAGLPSRSYAKLIMDGHRNVGLRTIPKLVRGLKLGRAEARYFEKLVQFTQAETSAEKNHLYEQLLQFPQRRKAVQLSQAQHHFYAKWFYAAIREMVLLEGFPRKASEQARWIRQATGSWVTLSQAGRAIEDLIALGLLERMPDGSLRQQDLFIRSPDEIADLGIRAFHRQMIQLSLSHLDDRLEDREFAGVTLAIRASDLPRAKAALKDFRSQFNHDFSAATGAEAVYQLGLQFFPLTALKEVRHENVDRRGDPGHQPGSSPSSGKR